MTRAMQLKLIKNAFHELQMLDLQDGFFDVAGRLLQMNLEQERRHRSGRPYCGLGVKDAAKLFTVSHILNGFNNPHYTVDDILWIRTEALYAQAYATKYHAELANFAAKYTKAFEQVDYAELMKEAA
jgi:hypothetical protein